MSKIWGIWRKYTLSATFPDDQQLRASLKGELEVRFAPEDEVLRNAIARAEEGDTIFNGQDGFSISVVTE